MLSFLRPRGADLDGPNVDPVDLSDADRALQLVRAMEEHGPAWFWQTDRAGRIMFLSRKVSDLFAGVGIEALGARLTDIFGFPTESLESERTLAFHLHSRTSFLDYSVQPVSSALERWWSITGRPEIDAAGVFQGFSGSGNDLTEKRRSEAEFARLAMYDGLTGLANRQRIRLMLDQTLAQARLRDQPVAILLLDLDRFKAVNDTIGHQGGDLLLKQVAQRLERAIAGAGIVGRLGGDEFQILLSPYDGDAALADRARQIILALSQPYLINGATASIGCSIGIAKSPEDGDDPETLVRNADLALYAAKAQGRGIHRFYREDMLHAAQVRRQLEDDLRAALPAGQLRIVYQAVVSTATEQVVGYEALLRWQHPVRGAISPTEFIPIAEECGLINGIGEWVLRTACKDAAGWPEHVRVAVNVSPLQFGHPALTGIVASALAEAGLPPGRLEIELTESTFLQQSVASDRMFKSLRALGVRLALDDFGTGYSSLGYLRTVKFDKIKIDQCFVRGAATPGSGQAAIIRAIVTLAENLGMETTAEGVEIQDEIAFIRDLGCTNIQGFVYGRPASSAEVCAALGSRGAVPVRAGHKISRVPRARVLRRSAIHIAGQRREVRIRNISARGVMVDGIDMAHAAIGSSVLIELKLGQPIGATVRWIRDRQAGLLFDEPCDPDRDDIG